MITRIMTAVFATLLMVTSSFAADAEGEWSITLSAAEGSTSIVMDIKVDGENATGTSDGDELKGTLKDGVLVLSGDLYIADAGMSDTADLKATIDGNSLEGNMSWGGYSLDMYGSK
ncbi:hypothetical protein [Pseudemcibacter aquimaris]|uniref:hypothetical protein n=1 Tax=Pseudemcibacter aquimaris TaxID=2857064 RepID=UPI002012B9EF|nr:hypothetical protein [Pseudemcibacter aquimaris]MCC3860669.1 hypothetical protein [Pseudemcibacter aquimaris]WDU59489.1 hypothetical protein KW060_04350 [Pseudemcibacter aquimaris]